jgi:hypothetical protein
MEIRRTSALPASTIEDNFNNFINFKPINSNLGGKIRHASVVDMLRTVDIPSKSNQLSLDSVRKN